MNLYSFSGVLISHILGGEIVFYHARLPSGKEVKTGRSKSSDRAGAKPYGSNTGKMLPQNALPPDSPLGRMATFI